jgi:uncharacterized protein
MKGGGLVEFHVAKLMQEPIGSTREYTLEHEGSVTRAKVKLTRLRDAVLVAFDGDVSLEQECARCLTLFGTTVPIHFEDLYYQREEEREEPVTDDPEAFFIDDRHIVDITEAVRQYKELSASLQPLCRDDCPGLCPECGADLTMGSCDCEPESIDPRMAALAALKRPSEG